MVFNAFSFDYEFFPSARTLFYFVEYRELIKGLLLDSVLPGEERMDRLSNLWVDLQKENR